MGVELRVACQSVSEWRRRYIYHHFRESGLLPVPPPPVQGLDRDHGQFDRPSFGYAPAPRWGSSSRHFACPTVAFRYVAFARIDLVLLFRLCPSIQSCFLLLRIHQNTWCSLGLGVGWVRVGVELG